MKSMKKYGLAALVAAAALAATSCVKDDTGNATEALPGQKTNVGLSWSVEGLKAGDDATRAGVAGATRVAPPDMGAGQAYDDRDPVVENMWILQFAGSAASGNLLGAPVFLDATDLATQPVAIPLTVSGNCTTLFIANMREGEQFNWNLSSQSTLADALSRVRTLTDESGLWEDFKTVNVKTLMMSDMITGAVANGTTLTPVFERNVAKVTLNLTLSNANMTIKSVQVRNVTNTITYANAALSLSGVTETTAPWPTDQTTFDYQPVTTGLPAAAGQNVGLVWYVPRNQQGANAASSAATTKNTYAPRNATYIEIIAAMGGATPSTSVFRIYPGANMTSDFNLLANHAYTVNLTVTDIGTNPADSRVQTFGLMDYTTTAAGKKSNSFIINPAPAGGAARTYRIPIDQANRFWSNTTDAGYGNNVSRVINAGDTWTANLIWSDLAGLFDPTGVSATAIKFTKSSDVGMARPYFELSVPAGLPAGNFTIGIKKDGVYLWSWHFWVTDYQPDKFNPATIATGVYTYPVPGGQVERYADAATGTQYWTGAGIYAAKAIMDRSLGAVESFFTNNVYNSAAPYYYRGILHYQFGRKDPFPAMPTVTPMAPGGETQTIAAQPGGGTVTVATGVVNPATFYTSSGDWKSDAQGTNYLWNDGLVLTTPGTGKSIHDPCPPGWKLPINGTWNDFNRGTAPNFIAAQNVQRDLAWGYGRGIGGVFAVTNGLRYWPGTALTDPVEGRIWYPATGYRVNTTGALTSVNSNFLCSSSTPNSATNAFTLYSLGGGITPSYANARSRGFSVRCVSE